jgi:hypothetical protein
MPIGDIQLTSAARTDMQPSQRGVDNAAYGDYQPDKSNTQPDELKDEPLSRVHVESFLFEIRTQPAWRREADRCADYYDGNQLSAETVDKLKERGQPPLISNFVAPTIDTVLGMEVKSRTDWRVRPEDDDIAGNDLAQALSIKLKHCETESRADRACSDAYAAQLKAGLGWVEVAEDPDPFKYAYTCKAIHRREIFWDWRAESYDLSDARYLVRRRWMDLNHAISMMPEYAELFRMTTSNWHGYDPLTEQQTGLVQGWEIERDTKMDKSDWRDALNQRVCLYEIWYRKWVRAYVLTLPSGQVIEADFNNPRHNEAIVAGAVQVSMATFQKIRLAWYCGPHFLYDIPSPHKHGYFPYVPFFGKREDQTQVPYGLIRAMISPQDEINARKSKMLWLLNSRRVITDSDSVLDHAKTADEVARADMYVILDKGRKPGSRFEITDGAQLGMEQLQVMQEAKQEIAETSGIHKSMMGQNSNASSGLAINSLLEQGLNTLAEVNDNFRFARRMVGEMLFSMLQQKLQGKPVSVPLGEGKSRKVIVLNEPVIDEQTGQQTIKNDVSKVRAKVVLDDVPSTPTFRMQQLQMLTEITKSLPPEIQGQIIDFIMAATDLPGKEEIVDRLRKSMHIADDSPEAEAAAQQEQQKQQAIQEQTIQLDLAAKKAAIDKMQAETDKMQAETEETLARARGEAIGEDPQAQAMRDNIAQLEQQLVMQGVDMQNAKAGAAHDTEAQIEKAHIDAAAKVEIAKLNQASDDKISALQDQLVELKNEIQYANSDKSGPPLVKKAVPVKPVAPAKRVISFKHDQDGRLIGAEVT